MAFFTKSHRQMQTEFGSTDLANRIVEAAVAEQLSNEQIDFIHSRNMFFLSTIDEAGFPSCSYKGGAQGFVRVLNANTLIFPNYDGNGMYLSMGNIEALGKVGLLFVDFETPKRVRLRGEARCHRDGPLLASYPGANLLVEVTIEHAWINCPRYVHQMQPTEQSPYVPDNAGRFHLALWKRIDLMQDVLTEKERVEAASLGLITIEDYEARVATGQLI